MDIEWALIRIVTTLKTFALAFVVVVFFFLSGQCELYHWIDLLDRFDLILEQAAQEADESKRPKTEENDTSCIFMCPKLEDPQVSLVGGYEGQDHIGSGC